jgi:hypothetical protein
MKSLSEDLHDQDLGYILDLAHVNRLTEMEPTYLRHASDGA